MIGKQYSHNKTLVYWQVLCMETVTTPKDVWSPISSLVHRGLFENERSAIINRVYDLSLSKIKEYKMAMQRFKTKYGVIF